MPRSDSLKAGCLGLSQGPKAQPALVISSLFAEPADVALNGSQLFVGHFESKAHLSDDGKEGSSRGYIWYGEQQTGANAAVGMRAQNVQSDKAHATTHTTYNIHAPHAPHLCCLPFSVSGAQQRQRAAPEHASCHYGRYSHTHTQSET